MQVNKLDEIYKSPEYLASEAEGALFRFGALHGDMSQEEKRNYLCEVKFQLDQLWGE